MRANISYDFRFHTVNNRTPTSFLYNDKVRSLHWTAPSASSNWNRQQTYTLARVDHRHGGSEGNNISRRTCSARPAT